MKGKRRHGPAFFGRSLALIVVVCLLPFGKQLLYLILPDVSGEIQTQSRILEQKLQSSQRLEVTHIEETGVMESRTNVILLGTVGKATIKYRYTASLGIDLRQVILTADDDRIHFYLPEPEILNDGIEALDVRKQDFFSHAIDKKTETLLDEQRSKCRKAYLNGQEHQEKIWIDMQKAFQKTLCQWLDPYGERHYSFEFHRQKQPEAEAFPNAI